MTHLLAFWGGGMVATAGYAAAEWKQGAKERYASWLRAHPLRYAVGLFLLILLWPATLQLGLSRQNEPDADEAEND